MKIDPVRLIAPLVAGLLLLLVVEQTLGALRTGGVWGRAPARTAATETYGRLEGLLRPEAPGAGPTRDPFAFGRVAAPEGARRPAGTPRPAPAAPALPPARPVLTSIVWTEGSPSATIRWQGRDYPVQVNTLFDEFRVLGITRDQVRLERGAEILVLQLPQKGDSA
jgi:hypothetical protein